MSSAGDRFDQMFKTLDGGRLPMAAMGIGAAVCL
jgi:hypothetical protein